MEEPITVVLADGLRAVQPRLTDAKILSGILLVLRERGR
jgi:hypothetical protein